MHDMAEVPPHPKRPRTEGDVERERVANIICEQLVEMSTTIQSFRTELRMIRENQKGLGVKLKKMEENQKGIIALIKDIEKSTFKIKDGPYEADLKRQTADLFCETLERYPPAKQISEVVVKVLKEDAKIKHKFDVAKGFVQSKLTYFRGEERRRVFGYEPCEKMAKLHTDALAEECMRFMQASDNSATLVQKYTYNLAVLRKFCREKGPQAEKETYKSFGQWLKEKFTMGKPTDEELEEIMEEDLHADFESPFDDPNNTESGSTSAQLDGSGTIISDSPRHWANQ